jgi:ubiquinone/menaquinone biosynthesis C-methylase UbiE
MLMTIAPSNQTGLLADTREAFDSVAPDYDGPRGNNVLIQAMRREMWRWLDATFPVPAELLDLGCGTGLDAVRLAARGHHVTATDWSTAMIARTRDRAQQECSSDCVTTAAIGAHELQRIPGSARFDGAYSNLGALNCVPNLSQTAAECARLLRPGGALVLTIIGRICPWELAHYALRSNWPRLAVRFKRDMVAVRLNKRVVWTRYYTPRELYRCFAREFTLTHHRGLCLFAPPPYLTAVRERYPRLHELLWSLDRSCAGWPGLRSMGDHFLMVLRRR